MLRKGRFRHRLLDDTFLNTKSFLASSSLHEFIPLWRQGRLSDYEMVAIYIFIFSFLRRPKDFLGGPHNHPLQSLKLTTPISGGEVLQRLEKHLPEELKNAKSMARIRPAPCFLTAFCSLSWRSIPLSAAVSLMAWQAGVYPLQLMTSLPSPEDVLKMQAAGVRCLSMMIEPHQINDFVEEGRDVLGFIIHDLIHADHFFADSDRAQAQVLFSQKMLHVQAQPAVQVMLKTDAAFRSEFEYLSSDMNSVPLHLLKTLKAIVLGHFKRRVHGSIKAPLESQFEQEFQRLFEAILAPWNLPPEALSAAHRLNTVDFKENSDAALLHSFLITNC